MAVSRRSFLRVGAGFLAGPALASRGLEASWADPERSLHLVRDDLIRIDSNENPNGPSDSALRALKEALSEAGRYPDEEALVTAIAGHHGVAAEQVLVGCGSTELLRLSVAAFATHGSGVVTAAPSFETIPRFAGNRGIPVAEIPVGRDLGLDLDPMLDRAAGAGLIYFCNPNNPTGTVHPKATAEEFVRRVLARSPTATVVVDEAYFEYVDDPGYGTLLPMALEDPRVVILRTMSKVHGMAGLRIGYALGHPAAIKALAAHRLNLGINVLGAAAAIASLADRRSIERERVRNREVRAFTRGFFEKAGFEVAPSHTNFVMVSIGRPIAEFRKACADRGVAVGRPFPPLTTHARISIGTMDEMKRATRTFAEVLGLQSTGG